MTTRPTYYPVPSDVEVAVTIRDADGTLATPAGAVVTVTKPDGTAVSPAPTATEESTGVFVFTVSLTSAGRWGWELVCTSPNVTADGELYARRSRADD